MAGPPVVRSWVSPIVVSFRFGILGRSGRFRNNLLIRLRSKRLVRVMVEGATLIFISAMAINQHIPAECFLRILWTIDISAFWYLPELLVITYHVLLVWEIQLAFGALGSVLPPTSRMCFVLSTIYHTPMTRYAALRACQRSL